MRSGSKPRKASGWRWLSQVALVAILSAVLFAVPGVASAPSFPTHRCGSFRLHSDSADAVSYRIAVFNRHVGCRIAKAVIHGFWSKDRAVRHGGPSNAESFWTIKGWPGWRCGQGAGGGLCHRHRKVAAYEARVIDRVSRLAQTSRRRRDAISFRGIGGVRWGARLERVEEGLGVSFDCSEGLVPGSCLCPPSEPDLSIVFVFDLQPPRRARLQALFTTSRSAHTPSGISVGSSKRATERAYPGARYEVNMSLTGGLSTFLLARHNGHALAFSLDNGRVSGIYAFARGGGDYLPSEQCA